MKRAYGSIRTTVYTKVLAAKIKHDVSAEVKNKLITEIAKKSKLKVGKVRSVVNFGLRNPDVMKAAIAA